MGGGLTRTKNILMWKPGVPFVIVMIIACIIVSFVVADIHMYIIWCVCICIYIYIYTYVYREREREKYIHTLTHNYVYIYIYIERERDVKFGI